nr:unnamed protein product [Spirometra erinaceieuropaei]
MQDAWTARKVEEIQGYADRTSEKASPLSKLSRSADEGHCSSPQHLRQHSPDCEDANPVAMGRALSRCPQPPLHHLRRRYRPPAASGGQRGPRLPSISPGNHQGRAAALQRENTRIGSNPC